MKPKILFIHPRKGLYRITRCNNCGHVFQCEHCDANLVTYRSSEYSLMMVCHQCQSHYSYPNKCPECGKKDISSLVGGADELSEELKHIFKQEPIRYDLDKTKQNMIVESKIAISTRIYDPLIPYSEYSYVILIHAENLFASPDYQVLEESMRQIAQLTKELAPGTTLFFDSKIPEHALFTTLTSSSGSKNNEIKEINGAKIAQNSDNNTESGLSMNTINSTINTVDWYEAFLDEEGANRKHFEFPPFHNIILCTSQKKNKTQSHQVIEGVYQELERIAKQLPDLSVTPPYEARFLKRKGMYSYHTFLRYPRKYKHFVALRKAIGEVEERFAIQVRLNPRHLF